MTKRDWKIIGMTLLTAWVCYCLSVAAAMPELPDPDPFWVEATVAYPFVCFMLICTLSCLLSLWKWALRCDHGA